MVFLYTLAYIAFGATLAASQGWVTVTKSADTIVYVTATNTVTDLPSVPNPYPTSSITPPDDPVGTTISTFTPPEVLIAAPPPSTAKPPESSLFGPFKISCKGSRFCSYLDWRNPCEEAMKKIDPKKKYHTEE